MYERYSTNAFEQEFTYSGNDLGAVWSPTETMFRVWAPTAQAVNIRFYENGDIQDPHLLYEIPMMPDRQGTWTAICPGNLSGLYYTYLAHVDGKTTECCDPYARTTGVNGQRAMVLDLADTDPPGWNQDRDPHAGAGINEAVIYELHLRDLSMDPKTDFRYPGKFLGLSEEGVVSPKGRPAGLDHICSMGVTHVHLLPVFDYGSVDEARPSYNWGYDPMNFNVPEGSYATDPYDGAVRVREFKNLVKHLHDRGLSVIMDVVYNHVYHWDKFCFNSLVPGYFSRIDAWGTPSNGSWCGNDTASERSMVRKYIADSVNYWADEYHIDGFRFDLVGLLDVQTIRLIMDTVHKKHPNVLFYGEGWTMGTTLTKQGVELAVQRNSALLPGFAFFSDTTRDLLRGSTFDPATRGFVSGAISDREMIDQCFMGMPVWAAQPSQVVNYVSCHDNHTLFDRIALAAPDGSLQQRIRMNRLAAAFTILSQGVPFFQAGEEFLRSKPGRRGGYEGNSYNAPDKVNALRWKNLDTAADTVEYYRGLLALRKAHPALRLTTRDEVLRRVKPLPHEDPFVAAYLVDDTAVELLIAFHAGQESTALELPDGADWQVLVRGDWAGTQVLGTVSNSVILEPISTLVLFRKKMVDVVAALIWEKDRFLICQRPAHKARGLLWEFVGGKVEPGETKEAALVRECREELDINVSVESKYTEVIHDYPDLLIRLTLYHCVIPRGLPRLLEHNAMEWIHPSKIAEYQFCPADADILKQIQKEYGSRPPL